MWWGLPTWFIAAVALLAGYAINEVLRQTLGVSIDLVIDRVKREMGFGPLPVLAARCETAPLAEDGWEWHHFVIDNEGLPRAGRTVNDAPDVWATVRVDSGSEIDLVWQSERGPVKRKTVSKGHPERIPFLFRALTKPGALYGITDLQPDVCYLTETDFLTQQRATHTLEPGQYDLLLPCVSPEGSRCVRRCRLRFQSKARGNRGL